MRWMCPFCGRIYATIGGVMAHIQKEHLNTSRCPACGKRFHGYRGLIAHLNMCREDPLHAVLFYASTGNFYTRKRLKPRVLPVITRV